MNWGFVQTNNTFGTGISENSAKNGGGLYNVGTAEFASVGDTFSDNKANSLSGWGGAIYNNVAGTLTLSDVLIAANSAYLGGGLANAGAATLTGVDVNNNTAHQGGGMYLRYNSTTTFNKPVTAVSNNHLIGTGATAKGVAFENGAVMNNLIFLNDQDDPGGNPVQV